MLWKVCLFDVEFVLPRVNIYQAFVNSFVTHKETMGHYIRSRKAWNLNNMVDTSSFIYGRDNSRASLSIDA